MGEEIDGAMQQAAQPMRHDTTCIRKNVQLECPARSKLRSPQSNFASFCQAVPARREDARLGYCWFLCVNGTERPSAVYLSPVYLPVRHHLESATSVPSCCCFRCSRDPKNPSGCLRRLPRSHLSPRPSAGLTLFARFLARPSTPRSCSDSDTSDSAVARRASCPRFKTVAARGPSSDLAT
jgi:hypothetical protein